MNVLYFLAVASVITLSLLLLAAAIDQREMWHEPTDYDDRAVREKIEEQREADFYHEVDEFPLDEDDAAVEAADERSTE